MTQQNDTQRNDVRRNDLVVQTRDGSCPSLLMTPVGEGPWPAVILFMDAGGVRPAMVDMAERLSRMGYVVLLPEMYYRHGSYEPFKLETAFSDPGERSRIMEMAGSVTKDHVVTDAEAFLQFLSQRPEVAGKGVGTTGYCLGGSFSLIAAAHHPDRIVAAASIHGGRLATESPESPHRFVDRMSGRVYVAAAENDGSFPAEQAALLEQTLADAGVDYKIEIYPALHGFAVPDNPTYDPEADARHWDALGDLFGSMLSS